MQVPADVRDRVASILEEAASILDTYGWVSGRYGGENSGYCAIGAIRRAHGGDHNSRWAGVEASTYLYAVGAIAGQVTPADHCGTRHSGMPQDKVACWNDNVGRTVEDVTDTLRLTAKDLRNAA